MKLKASYDKYSWAHLRVIILMVTVLAFAACGSNPNEQHIATVKGMQKELQAYEDMVSALDANVIREMQHEYGKVMNVINEKYISDSSGVDQKYGRMANLYKGVKKSKGFQAGQENVLKEIAVEKTQLENLLDDLENQDIPDADSVQYFVELERKAMNKIKLVAEKLQLNFDILIGVQDTVYPYMLGIVDSLNKIR